MLRLVQLYSFFKYSGGCQGKRAVLAAGEELRERLEGAR
jgi:hypothetical protein